MPEVYSLRAYGYLRCVQILDWVYRIYQERQHLNVMGWEWALKWPQIFLSCPQKDNFTWLIGADDENDRS